MDSKKTLKPELKEIYERVMNTKTATRATPQAQSHKPTVQPTPTSTPEKQLKSSTPVASASDSEKHTTSTQAATPEPYLPSSAPRAVPKRNDTYIFSSRGNNNTEKQTEKKADSAPTNTSEKSKYEDETKKNGNSLLPVLIGVITLFLIIYTVFWAFYFNII